jgi:hypothetical protein
LNPEKYFFHFFKAYFNFKYKIMETEKQKIEAEEPYQNVYEQYYQYDSDWHNWLCYIKGVIKEKGSDCDYIKSQISELDTYMLNSVLGKKWYECECPNLMENEPLSKRFLFFWEKMYEGKLNHIGDTKSRTDECNLFFLNYSKWIYLKSLISENSEKKKIGSNNQNEIKDTRRNVIDYFLDSSKMELVRTEADGKTGATLVSVFKKFIDNGVMETYPSYGSLVKDWNFPNDTTLENAKKGKL